ncbi:MAG: hypothetical protein PF450_13255 [Bacteroidales bacterium]|jgi:hypothetical protein|nr:hypothetical protein [Bacteroidales bacterium]
MKTNTFLILSLFLTITVSVQSQSPSLDSKIYGLLIGSDIFDQNMIDQVNTTMKKQYNQDVNDWMKIIQNQ